MLGGDERHRTNNFMNNTVRLTMAQTLVGFLHAQRIETDGEIKPLFPGIWAIFGHGNVAGLGEALYQARDTFPTYRAHNEQAMAHAAIAYAKATDRRHVFACTTSIGPGATNMVTAAALAHINRLPVLLLPGDTFASRAPDPVLQQLEDPSDPTITANDCFRPVSRYWDRITRPEQLLSSLPRAIQVLTDPAECGPVTLALPQDIQTEAWDCPAGFLEPVIHRVRRQAPDSRLLAGAGERIRNAQKPLLIAGGGVHYSRAWAQLERFCEKHGVPVAETQAGKGSLPWNHTLQMGSIGVTGSSAANDMAEEADLVFAVGTRLSDFTTASRTLFSNPDVELIGLNVLPFDAAKHGGYPLVGDARLGLQCLTDVLGDWQGSAEWLTVARSRSATWNGAVDDVTAADDTDLPSDAQVLGAVNRAAGPDGVVVCAAGGLPGELHKLWRASHPKGYHVEYGYSCMGYEIAGGLGAKMALPDREIFVLVGDGSYLMLNSEIATSVLLQQKIVIVVLDNGGFGCINRLQQACGGEPFNNLLDDSQPGQEARTPVDFAAHAQALGAISENVRGLAELGQALERAKSAEKTYVIALATSPDIATAQGGAWWDVAVPETSESKDVARAYDSYRIAKQAQKCL